MEDGELVAAEPRNGIAVARNLAHTVRQHPQQRIAGRMSERVVDLLEAVEVEKEQRHTAPRAPEVGHCRVQVLAKQRAIGEIGEAVVVSHVPDALTGQLLLRDVLGNSEDVLRSVGVVANGDRSRAQEAQAIMRGMDRLLLDELHLPGFERPAVSRHKPVGLLLGKEVVVGLADDGRARDPEEFFAGAVQQDETASGGILDENNPRHALDDRGEKSFVASEQRTEIGIARQQISHVASCGSACRPGAGTLRGHGFPLPGATMTEDS
jgi:hypothetical protein